MNSYPLGRAGEEAQARGARRSFGEALVRPFFCSFAAHVNVRRSKTQTQLPSSLGLASSSTLGTGRAITHQERLEKAEHHDVKRSMDGRAGAGKRKRATKVYDAAPESSDESDAFLDDESMARGVEHDEQIPGSSALNPVVIVDAEPRREGDVPSQQVKTVVIGGALKRQSDGTVPPPRVVKHKKKSTVIAMHSSFAVHSLP